MTRDKYVRYGLAIAAGAGLAVWAGLPPTLLVFLLICPLMMFFMMQGMHGGQEGHNEHHGPREARQPDNNAMKSSGVRPRRAPDGSHERIDHPRS